MSCDQKYSMIYNQGDRLEFRFFSPTLNGEKLNNYVALANVIYRRLAGKDAKLSKKVRDYLIHKMIFVNNLSMDIALDTINKINTLKCAVDLHVTKIDNEELEAA